MNEIEVNAESWLTAAGRVPVKPKDVRSREVGAPEVQATPFHGPTHASVPVQGCSPEDKRFSGSVSCDLTLRSREAVEGGGLGGDGEGGDGYAGGSGG